METSNESVTFNRMEILEALGAYARSKGIVLKGKYLAMSSDIEVSSVRGRAIDARIQSLTVRATDHPVDQRLTTQKSIGPIGE